MAFAVASMIAEGETTILNAHSVATSYPDFDKHRRTLQGGSNYWKSQ
jgi:5-enolpyruvylshikimate-3-phosphate synthase